MGCGADTDGSGAGAGDVVPVIPPVVTVPDVTGGVMPAVPIAIAPGVTGGGFCCFHEVSGTAAITGGRG